MIKGANGVGFVSQGRTGWGQQLLGRRSKIEGGDGGGFVWQGRTGGGRFERPCAGLPGENWRGTEASFLKLQIGLFRA